MNVKELTLNNTVSVKSEHGYDQEVGRLSQIEVNCVAYDKGGENEFIACADCSFIPIKSTWLRRMPHRTVEDDRDRNVFCIWSEKYQYYCLKLYEKIHQGNLIGWSIKLYYHDGLDVVFSCECVLQYQHQLENLYQIVTGEVL